MNPKHYPTVLCCLSSLLLSSFLPINANAQWIGATPDLNYNDPANWAGGVINDQFQGPYNWPSAQQTTANTVSFGTGATTISTGAFDLNSLVVGQTVTGTGIAANTTVTAIDKIAGTVTLSQATTGGSSGNYTFANLNNPWNVNMVSATHTVAGDFIYNNTSPANVRFTPNASSGVTWTFASATPTIAVDMGEVNIARTFFMGAGSRSLTWDFQGGNPVFAINADIGNIGSQNSADTLVLYATVENASSLTKTGGGRLTLMRDTKVDGSVNVLGGKLSLRNDAGQGRILGADKINIVNRGSAVELAPSVDNNLLDGSPVNMDAGAITLMSNGVSASIGSVSLAGGRSMIGNYTASDKTFTLSSLTRQNNATVTFAGSSQGGRGVGIGTLFKISGDDSNILSNLVGGGGAAGTTNISILPWASGVVANANEFSPSDTGLWGGTDLITYTSAGGFRALAAGEYFVADNTAGKTLADAGATDNVNLTNSATLSSAKTVNALKLGNNVTHTINSVLTITSGAIVGNSASFSGSGSINSGSEALIISGRGGVNFNIGISNSITDPTAAGVILANVGSGVSFNAANTYGGATVVQGYLNVGHNSGLPSATELRLDRSGSARINANITATVRELSGHGTLTFQIASNTNRLNVGTGLTGANNTLTVGNNGILSPGYGSGEFATGTLLLGANVNGLTFDNGSIFQVSIASLTAWDQVENINTNGLNTLTLNGGSIQLNLFDSYSGSVGDSWLLTSGFDVVAGDIANMSVTDNRGYDWSLSLSDNNILLTLNAVPEPSSALLLATGAIVILGAGRRFRRRD